MNIMKANRERVALLKSTIEKHLQDEDVQPGWPDWFGHTTYPDGKTAMTWCNRWMDRVLVNLSYDMTTLYNPAVGKNNIGWTSAIMMFDQAVKKSKGNFAITGVREISKAHAVAFANKGVPIAVLSREYVGHCATVWPSGNTDCVIAGAGSASIMGIHPFEFVYKPEWKISPRFFLIRKVEK